MGGWGRKNLKETIIIQRIVIRNKRGERGEIERTKNGDRLKKRSYVKHKQKEIEDNGNKEKRAKDERMCTVVFWTCAFMVGFNATKRTKTGRRCTVY